MVYVFLVTHVGLQQPRMQPTRNPVMKAVSRAIRGHMKNPSPSSNSVGGEVVLLDRSNNQEWKVELPL